MKKIAIFIIILVVIAMIGGFVFLNSNQNKNIDSNNNQNIVEISNSANNEKISNETNTKTTINEKDSNETMERIKLSFDNEEIYVKLDDNQTSRSFLEMLPLTVQFEDYNNTEKIAMLPEKLSLDGAPSGYEPQIGDFSYYAPWGNLSIFYKEFRYSNSLVKLGTFESGIEKLGNMNENFTVKIEKVD